MKIDYNSFGNTFEYRWKVDRGKKKDITARTLYIFKSCCPNCGDEYIHNVTKKGEFCSLDCRNKYKRDKRNEKPDYRDVRFDELKQGLVDTYVKNGRISLKTEKSLQNKDYNMYLKVMELTGFLDNELDRVKVSQRVYHIVNGLLDFPKCPCGNYIFKFISFSSGYNRYCSKECSSYYSLEKTKQTKLERYGTEYFNNVEKIKQTNLERYGVDNVSKSDGCKEKISKIYNNKTVEEKEEKQRKFEETCLSVYGVRNPFQDEGVKKKITQTSLDKYGTEHPFQNEEIKDRYKQTNLERYGVEWYTESDIWKDILRDIRSNETEEQIQNRVNKGRRTNIERYGVDSYSKTEEYRERVKQTCLELYGDENYNNLEQIKQTNLERYGVEGTSQHPEILNKIRSGFKNSWHNYQLPSGEWIKLQGYEPLGLNLLLEQYHQSEILFNKSSMPEIGYQGDDNTGHRYFPDFYVPKDNLIVEVKSDYTYQARLETNKLKEESTKYLGYNFMFMIFNNKKELVNGS